MTRLPARERILLLLFTPIWALCFVLSAAASLSQMGYPPVIVAGATGDAYPTVIGFKSGQGGEASGLRVGDQLLQVGGQAGDSRSESDLRGAGQIALAAAFAGWRGGEAVRVVFERAGVRGETTARAGSYGAYWARLPASLVFAITAVILLLRAAPSSLIRVIFGAYISWALLLACTFAGGPMTTVFSILIESLAFAFAVALGIRSAQLFPPGAVPPSAWARFAAWPFLLLAPLEVSRFYGTPFPRLVGVVGTTGLGLLSMGVLSGAVIHNYRQAGPIQRRQMKWILFALYCAILPPTVLSILAAYDARLETALVISVSSLGLVPIGLLFAIARYNLFDIDRLLSLAASYSILGVLLLAALLAAVPALAYSVSEPMGLEPETTRLALSLLAAALIVPLQRRLRPRVDRVLFTERYTLERGFQTLLEDLAGCVRPQDLTELAGVRLYSLLAAQSLVVYTRGTHAYGPALVLGRATPTSFALDGPLVDLLRTHSWPVSAERLARERRDLGKKLFDGAALEGVAVVVPVRLGGELIAFLCLGNKGSGDVYTGTDLAMLAGVADKISGEMRRFDQSEVIRQGRAMQESLRRYVPGAVAEELDSGRELAVGERDLSVLFVDIRNYTAYSEPRPPREVFAAVNRFTAAVSEVVHSEGGSVLEFSGDGVMAVFGAPHDLPDKERAAVAAARRIIATVDALALGGHESLSVGAGIATGKAYVGNVRSADRYIWTAIGNTTNLASRLQGLTRELDAAIVIDAPTWQRAGDAARCFDHHQRVAVRGQSAPVEVYFVALRAAAAA